MARKKSSVTTVIVSGFDAALVSAGDGYKRSSGASWLPPAGRYEVQLTSIGRETQAAKENKTAAGVLHMAFTILSGSLAGEEFERTLWIPVKSNKFAPGLAELRQFVAAFAGRQVKTAEAALGVLNEFDACEEDVCFEIEIVHKPVKNPEAGKRTHWENLIYHERLNLGDDGEFELEIEEDEEEEESGD